MSKKYLLLSTALTGTMAFSAGAWATPESPAQPYDNTFNPGPFWEWASGPSFSGGHLRGFMAGGVTYEQPFSGATNWGVHGELGLTYGENGHEQTDHAFTGQGVLYLRDAMVGEIGLYGGTTHFSNDFHHATTGFGAEGEYYLPNVTLGGAIGVQTDNTSHWITQGGVAIYPTDNLKLVFSALYEEGGHEAASFGVEYQPENGLFSLPGSQAVLFLNTTFSHEVAAIRAGLRWSWGGENSTLIFADRHQRKNFYGSILGSGGISPIDDLPYK